MAIRTRRLIAALLIAATAALGATTGLAAAAGSHPAPSRTVLADNWCC
jgi:hypothetical protein